MSKHESPAAFPEVPGDNNAYEGRPGMDLRDWFAGMLLPQTFALCVGDSSSQYLPGEQYPEYCARMAYRAADAMLAERAKGGAV